MIAFVLSFVLSAAAGQTTPARRPQLFGGSIVLDDVRPLVVLDPATAEVTVRLQDVFAQVGATNYGDVQAVPLTTGTLLVNRVTGTFNVLGKDDYALKRTGGGVGLGPLTATTGAQAIADGSSAYIVRYGPQSTVSLVGADTVQAAVRAAALSPEPPSDTQEEPGTNEEPAGGATVAPRGFAALGGSVVGRAGTAIEAGGDLWVIVDADGRQQVEQLRPSTANRLGLVAGSGGTAGPAGGPSALAAASVDGQTRVGLAGPGFIRLYGPPGASTGASTGASKSASTQRDIAVPATSGASEFVPVGGAEGTFWWLVRLSTGWSVVGLNVDAPRALLGRIVGPHPVPELNVAAQLVEPVWAAGRLYTMNQAFVGQPPLWEIDPQTGITHTVSGEPAYPAASAAERADFGAAELLVDGPRVIFNNPDSLLGVVVFTDGSRPPAVFDKSVAIDVSALGPTAVTPTAGGTATPATTPIPTQTVPPPTIPVAPQVSQQVTCANTSQTPRSPRVTQVVPAAHSVFVAWTYPLLDNQDCEPDSWTVHVEALGGPQPSQPLQLVTGQLQYQFNGLRPASGYQVVVTALIKQQATPSAPVPFMTAATGPDPPSAVTTVSDGDGDWMVSWTPCTASDCYVPADTWTVTGAACGSGFVGQLPSVQVPGDQTSVTIDAAAANLLGQSLSFRVQGLTSSGLPGDPTGDNACTEAWRPPDPSQISLHVSGVPTGQTVTAMFSVTTGEDPSEAFGSAAIQFTYRVAAPGVPPATVGPIADQSATIAGLVPGVQYQSSVTVTPTSHPAAAITLDGPPVTQNLAWPSSLAVAATAAVDPDNPNLGALTATFDALPEVPLAAAGSITCGSFQQSVGGDLMSGQLVISQLDLVSIGGNCTLAVQLSETQTHYYGVSSPDLSTTFDVPATQPDSSTFAAVYGGTSDDVQVIVSGQTQDKGANWEVAITNTFCVGQLRQSPSPLVFPLTFDLGGLPCSLGQLVKLNISWTYLGAEVSFPIVTQGTPPSTTTTTTTGSTTTSNPTTTTTTTKAKAGAAAQPRGPEPGEAATVLAGASVAEAGSRPHGSDAGSGGDALVAACVLAAAATLGGHRRRRGRTRT